MEQFERDSEDFLEKLSARMTSKDVFADSEIEELFAFMDQLVQEFEDHSLEVIEVLLDAIDSEGYTSSEEFARNVANNYEKFGPWLDEILVHVAEKSKIPQDLIEWFMKQDAEPFVMDGDLYNGSRTPIAGIAANVSTPPDILDELSKSDVWTIKWRVGMNTSSPQSALARLVGDFSEDSDVIIAGVALNPSSDVETLKAIIQLENPDLRTLATKNKNCSLELKEIGEKLGLVKRPFSKWGSGLSWMLLK